MLTVFTSLACSPRRTSRVGEDCRPPVTHVAATYPLRAARLFLLCVSLEVFATQTRRYHGRMLIHPCPPACATPQVKRCLHTRRFGTPRESAAACYRHALGTPSPAIDHLFLTFDFCQVPRRNFLQFFPFLVPLLLLLLEFS